jgi:hypothetical protein
MKRLIASVLSIIFFLLCVSCAASEEIVPEYDDSALESSVDLAGQTLIMGIVQDYFFEGADSTLSYTNNTEFGDLARQRLNDVQSKYNCKIKFDYVNRSGELAYNSAVAGVYLFDFITEESFFLVNYVRANAFVNLVTLDSLDVFDESKWGNRYMLVSTMFNGGIYGVLPAAHPMRLSNSIDCVLVVNEDAIANIQATDPRDLFENSEWNWSSFDNCIKTYAHTNQLTNEPVYSLASGFGGFSRELAMSNGVDVFTLNDNGNFTLGYFSQPAVEAYNQAYEWFYGDTVSNVLSNGSGDEFLRMVAEGETVMTLLSSWQIYSTTDSLAYRIDSFAVLPMPLGPNAKGQDDYKTSYSSADFSMCIPLTAKDPEISGFVLDKIYEPFEGYETEDDIIDYMYKNYVSDIRDAKFFVEMTKNNHVYYHDHMHSFSTMFDQFPSTGIARGLQTYETSHYDNAEKYVLPAYQTLYEYDEMFHD